MKLHTMAAAALLAIGAVSAAHAQVITKAPDIGPFWYPIGASGTKVYANSFVATATGKVTEFGAWMVDSSGPADLRFQIYESVDGQVSLGPDSSAALVTSGVIAGQSHTTLTYVSASPLTGGATLEAGHTYWFALSAVGLTGGSYQVGGHTQNSGGIVDNGTFWFSNAIDGIVFDGRGYGTEMAFQVTLGAVPEPQTYALMFGGLALVAGLARARRSRG